MVRKHNNQLPDNLPQLQNLIKRDPVSYHEEFMQQYHHFRNILDIFQLSPHMPNKALDELVMFMAQVAQCYTQELASFPQKLIDLLRKHNNVLENSMRMTLCRALILLRNKNLLAPTDLLELFFELLRCEDRTLRSFLKMHIITDIKNLNAKRKNLKLNRTLQNFMFKMLKDSESKSAKTALDIMIELYKKNVWNDGKTVNVIATGCFSKITKVTVASLKFFLGKDPDKEELNESDSEDEINPKEVATANKFNRKTRKRERQLMRVKKLASKARNKKSKAPSFNFSALHLVRDPQGMAEKLFKQLETTTKRFEVKLMTLDVTSRLIGLHGLFLFNFYPYIERFMQPHQREVTRILQFAAQASHELVPPDVIEPVLKTTADNFVTERNSSDVMAIGLNAIREICMRCPLGMSEHLLGDLARFKAYRDRSVMMAARSLISLFRSTRPELLHKKDRGRPSQASREFVSKRYAQIDTKDFIAGAEVLLKEGETDDVVLNSDDDDSSNEDVWMDILHSSDEDVELEKTSPSISNKRDLAQKVCIERILTDDDFKRIDMENVKKQVRYSNKAGKRTSAEMTTENSTSELVRLGDIENIHKKRKHDKQIRIDSVRRGQVNREKYGYKDGRLNEHCSKTNREKKKTKNYLMVRRKAKDKIKRSFKQKQMALRNYLIKQKRMK